MRYVRLIGGVLVLCVVATAARGEQLVLTGPDQTQDTMIRKSSPDDNHNNAWQVIIQKNFDKYLLRFDLSALPAGAVINSATLELTVNRVWAGGTVAARRVTESWTETGATWNSRDGVTAWTTAGGSSDSTNAASVNEKHST